MRIYGQQNSKTTLILLFLSLRHISSSPSLSPLSLQIRRQSPLRESVATRPHSPAEQHIRSPLHYCCDDVKITSSQSQKPMIGEIDDVVELVAFSSHDVLYFSLGFFSNIQHRITIAITSDLKIRLFCRQRSPVTMAAQD